MFNSQQSSNSWMMLSPSLSMYGFSFDCAETIADYLPDLRQFTVNSLVDVTLRRVCPEAIAGGNGDRTDNGGGLETTQYQTVNTFMRTAQDEMAFRLFQMCARAPYHAYETFFAQYLNATVLKRELSSLRALAMIADKYRYVYGMPYPDRRPHQLRRKLASVPPQGNRFDRPPYRLGVTQQLLVGFTLALSPQHGETLPDDLAPLPAECAFRRRIPVADQTFASTSTKASGANSRTTSQLSRLQTDSHLG
jgi:hypothetical protein